MGNQPKGERNEIRRDQSGSGGSYHQQARWRAGRSTLPARRTVRLDGQTHRDARLEDGEARHLQDTQSVPQGAQEGGQVYRRHPLGRITCSKEEIDLDLVVLSVADLGFKSGARYADICAKAVELGLELCPAEVGPALRLQYGDQPSGEWLRIAMEAITNRGGGRFVFSVFRVAHDLCLNHVYGHSDYVWHAGDRFVFGRRK